MESENESGYERQTKAGSAPRTPSPERDSKRVEELGVKIESESDGISNGLSMTDLDKTATGVESANSARGSHATAKKIVREFRECADRCEVAINDFLNRIDPRILGGGAGLILILDALVLFFWNRLSIAEKVSLESAFSFGLILFFCMVGLQKKFNSRIWTLLGTAAGLFLWITSLFVT